jgi:F-type H+-transporting ATPase subunit epsilon
LFKLTVVTPEKVVLDQDVRSIVAPGSEGYLGILTDHAPIITGLIAGKLTVTEPSQKTVDYAISGGFLEVSNNVATILADAIEMPDVIDVERAKKAEQRARERLMHRSDPNIDVARAEAALARAQNRLKMANK